MTSARPRGPGWHSVFHYILVSLAERHNPTALLHFFMELVVDVSFKKKKTERRVKGRRCFVLLQDRLHLLFGSVGDI